MIIHHRWRQRHRKIYCAALLISSHGADIAIAYLSETEDEKTTQKEIEKMGPMK